MKKKKKKTYEPPLVRQIEMETVCGQANCKTGSPTGGMNVGGDCDPGVVGSPPPGPCFTAGS